MERTRARDKSRVSGKKGNWMVSRKEMTASSDNVFYLYLLFLKSSPVLILTVSVREARNKYPNPYFRKKKIRMIR